MHNGWKLVSVEIYCNLIEHYWDEQRYHWIYMCYLIHILIQTSTSFSFILPVLCSFSTLFLSLNDAIQTQSTSIVHRRPIQFTFSTILYIILKMQTAIAIVRTFECSVINSFDDSICSFQNKNKSPTQIMIQNWIKYE